MTRHAAIKPVPIERGPSQTRARPIRVTAKGVLYRNPHPGHRAVNAQLPTICSGSGNGLLCVFRLGSAMYSPDGRLHRLRSHDNGRSWSHEGSVPTDKPGWNHTAPMLSMLANGDLLLLSIRADLSDQNCFMFHPDTAGLYPIELIFQRSVDGGATWSQPQAIQLPPGTPDNVQVAPSGPIIELTDSSWFLPLETWKRYEDKGELQLRTLGVYSQNGGMNWEGPVTVADGRDHRVSFSHGRFFRRQDGGLFAHLWTGNADMSENLHLNAVRSDRSGREWQRPQATNLPGQTSWSVEVPDKRLLTAYTRRDRKHPGIYVVRSNDTNGLDYDLTQQVVVWDAYGKEELGVAPNDRYPTSHDVIAYGRPHVMLLNDNEALVSFWCTQSSDTHIRYATISFK